MASIMEMVRYDELTSTNEAVRRNLFTWLSFLYGWFCTSGECLSECMMTLLVATVFIKHMTASHMETLKILLSLVIYRTQKGTQWLHFFYVVSYCHLSATFQNHDRHCWNLEDNWAMVRIFVAVLTFWHRNYFFLILAHPVYKMWIIQEPNTLELWNKLHFEVEKTEIIYHI